jgi:DNA-binding transcriptional LysR family regulator
MICHARIQPVTTNPGSEGSDAGERVHRTQSTVGQQVRRLDEDVGQPLLNRMGKDVTPTEAGERLLSYARRLLALAEEARDVLARPRTACSLAQFLRGRDERSSR